MFRWAAFPVVVIFLATLSGAAQAHTGVGDTNGFAHGFAHPMSGIDHILAMVAVGLLAAHLGGRALWLVPLSFVSMMAVGGALGIAGATLPYAEVGIGLSVVAFGALVALRTALPVAAAMAMVGFFALFHGHAHGAEMPQTASGLHYGLGFVTATAVLHAVGIGFGLLIGQIGQITGRRVLQMIGGGVAIAGVAILAGAL